MNNGPRIRILFAEHVPERLEILRETVCDALESGYSAAVEYAEASTQVAALKHMKTAARFDLVVTDWMWTPDVEPSREETIEGGPDLAQRARASDAGLVVVVTRHRTAKEKAEKDPNVDIAVMWEDIFEGAAPLAEQIMKGLGVHKGGQEIVMDKRQIFVVYGHAPKALGALSALLEDLDLRVLTFDGARTETVQMIRDTGQNRAVTTLDIVQYATRTAGAVLCLLTPDEAVRPRLTPRSTPELRPRPNVIFEAGMALALRPEATLLVKVGPTVNWSDVDGVQYASFANDPATRRSLVAWLEALGLPIDTRKTDNWDTKDYGLPDEWS